MIEDAVPRALPLIKPVPQSFPSYKQAESYVCEILQWNHFSYSLGGDAAFTLTTKDRRRIRTGIVREAEEAGKIQVNIEPDPPKQVLEVGSCQTPENIHGSLHSLEYIATIDNVSPCNAEHQERRKSHW